MNTVLEEARKQNVKGITPDIGDNPIGDQGETEPNRGPEDRAFRRATR